MGKKNETYEGESGGISSITDALGMGMGATATGDDGADDGGGGFLRSLRQSTAFKNRIMRSLTVRWRTKRGSRTSAASPSISNWATETDPSFR